MSEISEAAEALLIISPFIVFAGHRGHEECGTIYSGDINKPFFRLCPCVYTVFIAMLHFYGFYINVSTLD